MVSLSFDNREGYLWQNGSLVEWKNAEIHVLNHGLHYASCVFEGERAYNGKIFESEKHTERLFFFSKVPRYENTIFTRRNSRSKK